jgi:hypothetical protein
VKRAFKIFYTALVIFAMWASLFGWAYLLHVVPEQEWWSIPFLLPEMIIQVGAFFGGFMAIMFIWEVV